ncbi:MAG: transporter substrate-binding domain-containing protein [Desulfamplus sp.]|nr:transporter substrate-binding domain-containing protein [Desulfamplus sp.]
MKSWLLSLFVFIFTCNVYAEPIKVEILTDDANPPFSYEENKEAKGIYVNIIKAVFDKMPEYDVAIKPIPWQRGKKMMEDGKGFGLATAYFHGHDWPYLYPYSLPFASDILNVYYLKDESMKDRKVWPDDYKGLKIGRPMGYSGWGGPKFDEMVKNNTITLDEAKGITTQIMKLGGKRFDCMIMEQTTFNSEYHKLVKNGEYKSEWGEPKIGIQISKNDVYIGYSKKAIESGLYPFHMDFMQKFDSELFKMILSGERDKILNAN